MKCGICGDDSVLCIGTIREKDIRIGDYEIAHAKYYKCISCNERLYPLDTVKSLDKKRSEILSTLIREHPIGDFMSASETARFLGITRQALHKHSRIRNGFIYQTDFSGKTVYLRKSAELFKKTDDGRFSLSPTLDTETSTKHTMSMAPLLMYSRLHQESGDLSNRKTWSFPVTETAMRLVDGQKKEGAEFVYPDETSQLFETVRKEKDVQYG